MKKHRGQILIGIAILLLVTSTVFLYRSNPSWGNTFAITLIAAGIPGVYYAYKEWVLRPVIIIGDIDPVVAPMRRKVSISEDRQIHLIRPEIFYRVKIANFGKASAKKCMVRIQFISQEEDNYSKIADARWAVTSNPERYNLLPGEDRYCHLLKTLPSPKRQITVNPETNRNEVRTIPGLEIGDVIPSMIGDFRDPQVINPSIVYPGKKPPERSDRTIGGDWIGRELREGKYKIKIKVIAENYKKKGCFPELNLPCHSFKKMINADNWKDSWKDLLVGYEQFQEEIINSGKEYIDHNCES